MKIDGLRASTEDEISPSRKIPWPIDALLYPCSISGLVHLGIFVFAQIILTMVGKLIPSFFMMIGLLVIRVIFGIYLFNYFNWCVNDSANGGLRAPEPEYFSGGSGPDYLDILNDLLPVLLPVIICFVPAIVVNFVPDLDDKYCWVLLSVGFYFFPMMLLASIMFDTWHVFNPVLILGSIFSCFFRYLIIAASLPVIVIILYVVLNRISTGVLSRVIMFLCFVYMTFVYAHFVGRFYYLSSEKLNWEV